MYKVRYYETDQMGFVHHSNYLKYFEMARIEWFDFLDIRSVSYTHLTLPTSDLV